MKSVVVSPFAALIALALWPAPQAFAQAFGEPTPEVRAFRNREVERAASERPTDSHGHSHAHGDGHDHGVESEIIFGFTLGSDTHPSGENKVAVETVTRLGKLSSHYVAVGQKIEFAHAFTNDLSMSGSLLGDYHRISARNGHEGEGEVEPVAGRYLFNGLGGELRYRFLNRATSPSWPLRALIL